jgi:hypothetical protein
MPLAKGTTYDNIYFDYVLNPLKDLLKDEFPSSAIYVSPTIKDKGNFQIKLWGTLAVSDDYRLNSWSKTYNVTLDLYMVESGANERFYEDLYARAERVYQLLYNNITKSTTITYDLGSGIGSAVSKTWINGSVSEMIVNDFAEDEDIEGLHKVSLDFSCNVERDN